MAERIGELAYKLTVDNGQFSAGMGQAGTQIDKLAGQSGKGGAAIQAAFANVGTSGTQVFQSLTSGGPAAAIASLQGGVIGIGEAFTSALGPAGLIVGGLAAGLAALVTQAESTTKALQQIGRTARVLGESVRDTQVLLQVFSAGGFDPAEAQALLLKFQNKIGELRQNPNAPIAHSLRNIGIDPTTIANAPLVESFGRINEALRNTANGFDRATAAREIFGRGSVELADIIARGANAVNVAQRDTDRYGASPETLARVEALRQKWKDFEAENVSIAKTIGKAWDEAMVGISEGWLAFNRLTASSLEGMFHLNAIRRQAETLARIQRELEVAEAARAAARAAATPEAIAAAIAARTRTANLEASALGDNWRRTAGEIGLSGRQLEIYRLAQKGATAQELDALHVQDRHLARIEAEVRLRQTMRDQLRNERPEMLALTGLDANSLEGVKLSVGLQQQAEHRASTEESFDRSVRDAADLTIAEISEATRRIVQAIEEARLRTP